MSMTPSTAKKAAPRKRAPADRKPPSLRDQLKSKRPRETSVTFPLGQAGEEAKAELEDAQQGLAMLKWLNSKSKDGKQTDLAPTEERIAKAEAAFAKASMTLRFRGLTPIEVDALRNEFELSEEDVAAGKRFDSRGYVCAMLAAATIDSDLTAEEWDEELYESGRWSDGEILLMRDTARAAYEETSAPGIPKG